MIRGLYSAIALCGTLTVIAGSANAQNACSQIDAGSIIGFQNPASGYEIIRGDQRVPVGAYVGLFDGDRVRVLSGSGRILVQRSDKSTYPIVFSATPKCVTGASAGIVPNVLRRWGEQFTSAQVASGNLVSREGALALRPQDLAAGEAQIAAGQRALAITWVGGFAPFSVEVRDAAGNLLVDEKAIKTRLLRLRASRAIIAGRYTLLVRDTRGAAASGAFLAIADPAFTGDPNEADRALAEAARLLSLGETRRFDAFLSASRFRKESDTAEAITETLATRTSP